MVSLMKLGLIHIGLFSLVTLPSHVNLSPLFLSSPSVS